MKMLLMNKKSLLRAIIKKIEVQPNRKEIKGITYWFDCDNGQDDALLVSKEGELYHKY